MRRMDSTSSDARATFRADPRLAALRLWLSAGTALLLLMPIEAWYHPAIGWLPYWWVVTPAIGIALLRRGAWLLPAHVGLGAPVVHRAGPARSRPRRSTARRTRARPVPHPAPALIRG